MFMRCPSPLPPFPPHSNIEAVGGALRNIPARDKLGHHLGASRGHKHPISGCEPDQQGLRRARLVHGVP